MNWNMRVSVWLVVLALCAAFLGQCDGGGVDPPVSPVPRPTLAPPVSPPSIGSGQGPGTIGGVE